jgi:hypothetical protein
LIEVVEAMNYFNPIWLEIAAKSRAPQRCAILPSRILNHSMATTEYDFPVTGPPRKELREVPLSQQNARPPRHLQR